MNLSIQKKLFLLLAGLTSLVLVVVLVAVNNTATENITQGVFDDFEQTQTFFLTSQRLRYDRLVESALLVQENSTFKANVELNDPPTMQVAIEQFAPFIKADLFVVTNTKGTVLAWLGKKGALGQNLSHRQTISRAMEGIDPPLQIEWPDLWAVDAKLYQVVTVPVYTGADRLIGTITLGTEFTKVEAKDLVQNTPLDVVLFLGDTPIASSKDSISAERGQIFVQRNKVKVDSILSNLVISEPFINEINGEEYFSFMSPLGEGEPAFYVANVPASVELQILNNIQSNIFSIGIITIIIIIPIAIYLGRIISKPINSLSKAMLQVQDGKLDISVKPTTNDEIGLLAKSFNQMVVGLRERFTLQKYVGGHTMQMIQKNDETESKLGGRLQNLAILFTDIRDSTQSIEKEAPEDFIKHLNQCLTYQSEYVTEYDGSIDKYVGDSMIALFDGEGALERAVKCAAAIQKRFKKERDDHPFFRGLGVGVNHGSMLLGNMGANERMDYTVIGPEVNLCARLCETAQSGQILLPKSVIEHQKIDIDFKIREVDTKKFKGFSKELEIVEVIYE